MVPRALLVPAPIPSERRCNASVVAAQNSVRTKSSTSMQQHNGNGCDFGTDPVARGVPCRHWRLPVGWPCSAQRGEEFGSGCPGGSIMFRGGAQFEEDSRFAGHSKNDSGFTVCRGPRPALLLVWAHCGKCEPHNVLRALSGGCEETEG